MFFSFGVETTFNTRVEPTYAMDMAREQLLINKGYKNIKEFQSLHTPQRVEQNHDVVGQVGLELTFGNEGWGRIFEVLLGKRTRLTNRRFEMHQNGLELLVGKLSGDITAVATSFTLDEPRAGILDGTHDLIIGDELLTDGVITNGAVTGISRGSGSTTAAIHFDDDLAYVVSDSTNRSIDICSPNLTDSRLVLDKSLSIYINRPNDYFVYTGMRVDQLEFNLNPNDVVEANITFAGADSTNLSPITPLTTEDEGNLATKIFVMSLLEQLDLRRLYINFNNTLIKSLYGYDFVRQDLPASAQAVFGQVTFLFDELADYTDYINNVKRNLSIQMIDWSASPFEKAVILNSNDMRVNTFAPQFTRGPVVQHSAPFYTYRESQVYLQY
ncbi:hypothetical protein LCGC14_1667270 [marine sediment metagenome]|uniref:Uncharacterized protein n=1 Tax=marine sediment metagenome TaxID=412755 RepID=A0A0F9K854_9ZZZZ